MAVNEVSGFLKYRDTDGDLNLFYPITTKDCVDGMEEVDEHIADTTNPHGVTAAQVGLGNVDNTSDANKPVSTAQATAIADAKKAGTDAQTNLASHVNNKSNPHNDVYYTKLEIDNLELITVDDIDTICGASIQAATLNNEVRF